MVQDIVKETETTITNKDGNLYRKRISNRRKQLLEVMMFFSSIIILIGITTRTNPITFIGLMFLIPVWIYYGFHEPQWIGKDPEIFKK